MSPRPTCLGAAITLLALGVSPVLAGGPEVLPPQVRPGTSVAQHDPVALSPEVVLGTWRLRGDDPRLGPIRGEMTFQTAQGGLRYTRTVEADRPGGERRVEQGKAAVVRGWLVCREEQPAEGTGIVRLGKGGELAGSQLRRGFYKLHPSGLAMRGLSRVPEGQGRESLFRADDLAANNDVRLLIDGPEAFPAIYAALEGAERTICLQTFSWFDDAAGRRMADLLRAKVAQGVKVRVLIEAFPQKGGIGWKTGPYLKAGGVEVVMHHFMTEGIKNSVGSFFGRVWGGIRRLFGGKKPEPKEHRGWLNHDHRKLIVVDGWVAFTGGMNIGDKYESGETWHDIHCRVEGSAARRMEGMFFERWHAAGAKGEADAPVVRDPWPGQLDVDVVENLPGLRLDVTQRYLSEIRAARSEILIENPYFLYDPVVNALRRQAQVGVRTLVIVPDNDQNDEGLARDAMAWVENDLIRAGIELYKYRDRMAHGKVAVWDQRVSTVGTTNLDMLAMEKNAELNLFLRDPGFACYMVQRVFATDVPRSRRVVPVRHKWWDRTKGFALYSMRGFL